MGADFAMASDFCAVFLGCCADPTSLTWGNVGAVGLSSRIRLQNRPEVMDRFDGVSADSISLYVFQ